jgi:hypothetical protein
MEDTVDAYDEFTILMDPDVPEPAEKVAGGSKLFAGVIIPKKGLLEMKKILESGPSCDPFEDEVTNEIVLLDVMRLDVTEIEWM